VSILRDELRLLTFRSVGPGVHERWRSYLGFGLFFAWLAGVGRYWDNPKAELWQLLGLGSVAYVFVLALVLWALLAPLRPQHWSYRTVVTFVALTSPPAVLYAIPVERFMSLDAARAANAWFLAIVAAWRVALLVVFLHRTAKLPPATVVLATLLPLAIIVFTLYVLNLEHVVFQMMSGIRDEPPGPNDSAYGVVVLLSVLSYLLSPILFIWYIALVVTTWRRPKPAADQN
jgi:hypothetical protein